MIRFRRIDRLTRRTKELLRGLQVSCLPDDDPVFPVNGWWWIGYSDKYPIAFCLLQPSSGWLDTVYLARSGVLYLWRGRGLQKRMITLRERFAKKRGYVWVISDTTDNPPSANSLARRGYQMFNPARPWALENSLYWRKKLR